MKNTTIAMAAVLFLAPALKAADINFDNNKFNVKGFIAASKAEANSNLPKVTLVETPVTVEAVSTAKFNPNTRTGRVFGTFANNPVNLTFTRTAWTLDGMVNGKFVNLQMDMNSQFISGFANDKAVALNFKWGTEVTSVNGTANNGPLSLAADWNTGSLDGYTADGGVHCNFNLEAGYINGYAGKSQVNLNFNKISGRLSGTIGSERVDLTMSNMNDADIMTFFFLFLK